ncbi:ammonium transporter [Rhodopila sp.]|jgi:Amt family ammonium transporter|uniref:ammonium transporter n=1 Tax=Rhodopila sp. TaxID=2480087 RepID=UPI002CBFB23D|nr:ammonium transporter [Rhodopila sp.]HVZ10519.1 ammonium transporter [Rhodopila sp.]
MKRLPRAWGLGAALPALLLAMPAFADDGPPKLDSGDTAWMLASTALVLLMTIPGLALFYGGMVRKKNVLATLMQSFVVCCIVTIAWCVVGYSLAFTPGGAYVGDLSRILLSGIADHISKGNDTQAFVLASGIKDVSSMSTTIPETVYMMFQMTFAIITPALICGAFADRMKFSALCIFITMWSILVYAPIAHWVWAPSGWAAQMGVLDFAGGTVVHINAGIAGLVCALVLGKRVGYGTDNMAPYNLAYAVIGASLLWVGWFGFNAGSAVAANGRAGMAMAVTQIATAAAALGWMFAEWITKGKPSVLGAISGAVAGLVAITPASGFVLPGSSIIIGVAAGVICFWSATSLKHMLGYDDSLDAFGVHGIGGIVGALLTGVFAYGPLSATDASPDGTSGGLDQLKLQAIGVCATLIYSGVMTFVLLMITKALVGLRVTEEEEREGLDIVLHGEQIF